MGQNYGEALEVSMEVGDQEAKDQEIMGGGECFGWYFEIRLVMMLLVAELWKSPGGKHGEEVTRKLNIR